MAEKDARNRLLCRLFALLFFLALALPAPLWLALRGGLDAENRENRGPAAFPVPGEVAPDAWPHAFEDWLADHAPFRNQWMTANAALNWRVFGGIESEVVLPGLEGWMFYRNAEDSASLDDYQGTNLYTEAQVAEIAGNLERLRAALAERGVRQAVLIAPNKELVYRRYMPPSVPMVNPVGRIDALAARLPELCEAPFMWPEADLRALGETQRIYYMYDTHWNEAGAAYASALLQQALGGPGPDPAQLSFEPSATPPLRDLANLSATWKLAGPDESWQAANWMPGVTVEHLDRDERGWVDHYASDVARVQGGAPQKLLMLRDSFGEAMREPLAACYAESAFVHINAFDERTLAEEAPDVFVVEITQRYADRLLDWLPRLAAWAQAG